MNQPANAIVLAVGHQGCDAALEFVAAEAERTRHPVHLVRVLHVPTTVEYAGVYAVSVKDFDAEIEQALAGARKRLGDTIPVTGEGVVDGGVVDQLVRRADRGRMVVLQQRRLGTLHRLVTGSTTNGVAARAEVPVVSVPPDWTESDDRTLVTVAVQDAGEAGWLLRAGYEQAKARQAKLVVLHAWWLANGYDDVAVDEAMRRQREARMREALTPAMSELAAEFPEVEVALRVQHAPSAEAILDEAKKSALLVLSRRHHLLPLGTHLGPVARATLHHSTCPVLMVPPPR